MDEGLTAALLPRDKDPFWDPVEPLLLGTAHLWLHSLAYRIPLEEQIEVLTDNTHTQKHVSCSWRQTDLLWMQVMGSEGTDEGIVQAELVPCTSSGLYD